MKFVKIIFTIPSSSEIQTNAITHTKLLTSVRVLLYNVMVYTIVVLCKRVCLIIQCL